MNHPLPKDLKRLLAIEPRILDFDQKERTIYTYPGLNSAEDRIAAHIQRLTGETAPRSLRVTRRFWRGLIEPLGNPVSIAADLKERYDFSEADAADPTAVWIRPVEVGEEEAG